MVFKCQEDSFLQEFTSKVVSCTESEFETTVKGLKQKIKGYEVIFEDTVLFPEGGGQPSDHGSLNDQKVHQVLRRGDKAVHLVEKPFSVGEDVKQTVNWQRRLDHMQQHSGQHLITAIFDREYKVPTVSWYMGEDVSYIELECPSLVSESIQKVESICNDLIREGRKVTVHVYAENTPMDELGEYRSPRGLPADHKGDIRVVHIDGIDSNMCCGTHVASLSQLQVVKLLHWEKSKRKGQCLLYFLVGNRVIERLDKCIEREQKLTALLKSNPCQHPELVEKVQQNLKVVNKNLQTVLKDLAVFEANKLRNESSEKTKYFCLHKKEGDSDFMNTFVRELDRDDIFLFLSVGDEKGAGNIVLYGEEKCISDLGTKISDLLGGKGAGKGKKFQAKVSNMGKRKEVVKLIEEYFKQ